jgi:hypothetical protein
MKGVMEKGQGDEGTEQIKGTERIQGVRIQSMCGEERTRIRAEGTEPVRRGQNRKKV